ncbi:MAG: class I SAM-dependent methyltransferase [Candidatus Hodarchaeota archaeon]
MKDRKSIFIGILTFDGPSPEVYEDHFRFAYHLGRRYPEYDFFSGIRSRSEQFRARNSIIEGAIYTGSDYCLMLDDDHVIAIEYSDRPTEQYDFLKKLIGHMENDPQMGLCGVLYFQRGLECKPVIYREAEGGGFISYRDDEIQHRLQQVAVTGGGCMLINMKIFDKIDAPWFAPEHDYGTDMQLAIQAKKAGFTVWCDTSIEVSHEKMERKIITSKNRHQEYVDSLIKGVKPGEGYREIDTSGVMTLFQMDAMEYLGMTADQISSLAVQYDEINYPRFKKYDNIDDYYRTLGPEQLARQMVFHSQVVKTKFNHFVLNVLDPLECASGLDYGCGCGLVGFELAMQGHQVDFVDIDGSYSYEFLKWRAKKRNIKCGWNLGGPYDFVLMLDSIEHIKDWEPVLKNICSRIKDERLLITNYFLNENYNNVEHISMDKDAVSKCLMDCGLFSINRIIWVKTGKIR